MAEPMKQARLTREEFLARSLEVVARRGGARLRIQELVGELGLTTGSFYWHFEGRDEFVAALVEYWASAYTGRVIEYVEAAGVDPQRRFRALIEYLAEENPARYDVPMRAWSAQEAIVARHVRRVDRQRLAYVRALLSDLGLRGQELELRTRIFVVYQSLDLFLAGRPSRARRREQIDRLYAFFTR